MELKDRIDALTKMLEHHDDAFRLAQAVETKAQDLGDSELTELTGLLKQRQSLSKEELWRFFIRLLSEASNIDENISDIEKLEHAYFVAEDDIKVGVCKDLRRALAGDSHLKPVDTIAGP